MKNCTRCKREIEGEYTVVQRTRRKPEHDNVVGPDGVRYSVGIYDPNGTPDATLCETCASFVDAAIAGRPCFSRGEHE